MQFKTQFEHQTNASLYREYHHVLDTNLNVINASPYKIVSEYDQEIHVRVC